MAKQFKGKVVRCGKMEKTVVVEVERRRAHPVYGKVVGRRKWYHVHDEVGVKEGERVVFEETRPISKTKRWRIVKTQNPNDKIPAYAGATAGRQSSKRKRGKRK